VTHTAAIPVQTTSATQRYVCEPARAGDERAIAALLHQPMPGRVSIATTHEPDHRAAVGLASERVAEVVVRDRSDTPPKIVGYGYRAVRRVSINGRVHPVGYLGGLRCEANLRAAFRVLSGALDRLDEDRADGEKPYDLTSIMADNTPARRILEKGLPGLPTYVPVGEMATLTIRAARHGRRDPRVTTAKANDTSAIQAMLDDVGQRYHGRHAWRLATNASARPGDEPEARDFLVYHAKKDRLGCLALWDQCALRQIVVADLSPALRRLRPAINLAAGLTGRPMLPRPGRRLKMAYASHAALDLDDADVAGALIAGVCATAAERGIELMSLGVPAETPMLPHLIRRFKPWISRSVIYAVTREAEAVDLDPRPVWMEVAML
jgi:hypothetical protein